MHRNRASSMRCGILISSPIPKDGRGHLMVFIDGDVGRLVVGDSDRLLQQYPEGMFDLVITSPPYYRQRSYEAGGIGNEGSVEEYISDLMRIFSQCVRVTKRTGSIVFNIGDKHDNGDLMLVPYRFALAVKEEHPELVLVNDITWVKTNPTPRQFGRRLVSSTEPFFHWARTKDYHYDRDAFLAGDDEVSEPNPDTRIGSGYFTQIESSDLTDDQKSLARTELSEAIEKVRRGEATGLRMKIRGVHSEPFGGQGGGRMIQLERKGFTIILLHGKRMKRDVIVSPVETVPGSKHPAMFPVGIVEQVVRLLSPEGGLVLDPFMGSGSTALACLRSKRCYHGIDISEEYIKEAIERVVAWHEGCLQKEIDDDEQSL